MEILPCNTSSCFKIPILLIHFCSSLFPLSSSCPPISSIHLCVIWHCSINPKPGLYNPIRVRTHMHTYTNTHTQAVQTRCMHDCRLVQNAMCTCDDVFTSACISSREILQVSASLDLVACMFSCSCVCGSVYVQSGLSWPVIS